MNDSNIEVVKCSMFNWTGLVYKISRTVAKDYLNNEKLKQSGVYFLLGGESSEERFVYIGQGGVRQTGRGVLTRAISAHSNIDEDKYYWTEAILFTTEGDSFGPTEMNYLENMFYNMAKTAGTYKVINASEPTKGNVTEEKTSDLDAFIQNVKIITKILGHNIFTTLTQQDNITSTDACHSTDDQLELYEFRSGSITAMMQRISNGVVLLKDSEIKSEISDSMSSSARIKREEYKNFIVANRITKDLMFGSPSQALGFVTGYSVSGPQSWRRRSDGKTLKKVDAS